RQFRVPARQQRIQRRPPVRRARPAIPHHRPQLVQRPLAPKRQPQTLRQQPHLAVLAVPQLGFQFRPPLRHRQIPPPLQRRRNPAQNVQLQLRVRTLVQHLDQPRQRVTFLRQRICCAHIEKHSQPNRQDRGGKYFA